MFTKWERSLISSALEKSSFLKSMLLPNFAFDVFIQEIKNSNKNNISMMFKQVFFDDFESMLLQKLGPICMMTFIKASLRVIFEINNSFLQRRWCLDFEETIELFQQI